MKVLIWIYKFSYKTFQIHRIRCLVPYLARVVSIVSPSEIWLQHPNHISDKLTETFLYEFPSLTLLNYTFRSSTRPIDPTKLTKGLYVMARLDTTTLARARILDIRNNTVYIRFIDHGFTDAVKPNTLFRMSLTLRTYPWQTVPVCLNDVLPFNNVCFYTSSTDLCSLYPIYQQGPPF